MYLTIVLIPILGAIAAGLRGRAIGTTGAGIVTTITLSISIILSFIAFYEVAICGSAVRVELTS